MSALPTLPAGPLVTDVTHVIVDKMRRLQVLRMAAAELAREIAAEARATGATRWDAYQMAARPLWSHRHMGDL